MSKDETRFKKEGVDVRFVDTETKRNGSHNDLRLVSHPALMDVLLLRGIDTGKL